MYFVYFIFQIGPSLETFKDVIEEARGPANVVNLRSGGFTGGEDYFHFTSQIIRTFF